jgi:hypothetical protein
MIRNKTHKRILEQNIKYYKAEIKDLEERLKKAENLETILTKFYSIFTSSGQILKMDYMSGELILPDDILRYVDDLFGGKVIKQEGVKAIKIEKDGTIKTGLTKQKADEGRIYKLVQE